MGEEGLGTRLEFPQENIGSPPPANKNSWTRAFILEGGKKGRGNSTVGGSKAEEAVCAS